MNSFSLLSYSVSYCLQMQHSREIHTIVCNGCLGQSSIPPILRSFVAHECQKEKLQQHTLTQLVSKCRAFVQVRKAINKPKSLTLRLGAPGPRNTRASNGCTRSCTSVTSSNRITLNNTPQFLYFLESIIHSRHTICNFNISVLPFIIYFFKHSRK